MPADPPIFPDGELSVRPQERRIDMILRAGFAAGASQVLMRAGAPLALRIGAAFVRPGAHGLSPDFVELLAGEIVTPSERTALGPDEELEVEVGVSPYAPCTASVFLGAGKPSVLIRLPGVEVERDEAPAPAPEELRPRPLALSVEGCRREIRDCVEQCKHLHDLRVMQADAARRAPKDPADTSREATVTPLKWRDSRSRSRRLLDRLWEVTARTETEESLEMARAILREATAILEKLKALKPALQETAPPPRPVLYLAEVKVTGNLLIDTGFRMGASELCLTNGETPYFMVNGRSRLAEGGEITRRQMEEVLAAAWALGEKQAKPGAPSPPQFALQVQVMRKSPRMEVTIKYVISGGKGPDFVLPGGASTSSPPVASVQDRPAWKGLPPNPQN